MQNDTTEKYAAVSPQDIAELKAIYEDFLFMARQHELIFKREKIDDISARQVKSMYPECKNPYRFTLPWFAEKLNIDEKQKFKDYIENNTSGDGRTTYVSLQHIRTEDNNGEGPIFTLEPYQNISIAMQLPSRLEKYTLSFPKDATFQSTEFHVDGRYKVIYWGDKYKDTPMADCINNPDLITEITIMINAGEAFRRNNYKNDTKFERMVVNAYAEEITGCEENNLLEMLGMFTEKVMDLCHSQYHQGGIDDLKIASANQFINISADFLDYFNIRNFLRHQWDTLDDLDDFSFRKSLKNRSIRLERANSMLKICDKTIHQRMAFFIQALHQMQKVISAVDYDFIIRAPSESNTKFVKRLKVLCKQNPDRQFDVEMNLPLHDKKYIDLNETLHKKKLFPNIRVVDDFADDNNRFERMEDYTKRSIFLRKCHGLESVAMGYCQRRALDKNNRDAWDYLCEIGVITAEECQTWQNYTTFRNSLAHDCFDADLRKQLSEIETKFEQDFSIMTKKIYEANPKVRKIEDDLLQYEHIDGKITTVDYISHERETKSSTEATANIQNETYRNGIEFILNNDEITLVKFPNGVSINMQKHNIIWSNQTRFYTNAKNFNALQTPHSTIMTDKNLKVKEIYTENKLQPCDYGNNLLIDDCHSILIDNEGKITEFVFKNTQNKSITTTFKHQSEDKSDLILFDDGTKILLSAQEITVTHNGKILNFDTRHEFAKTYDKAHLVAPQINKTEFER